MGTTTRRTRRALSRGSRAAAFAASPAHTAPDPEEITIEPRKGRKPVRHDPVALALAGSHRLLEPLDTN